MLTTLWIKYFESENYEDKQENTLKFEYYEKNMRESNSNQEIFNLSDTSFIDKIMYSNFCELLGSSLQQECEEENFSS